MKDRALQQRVFIIWSNPILHDSLRVLLRHPDVSIVGDSSNIHSAYEEIVRSHANVVLVEDLDEKQVNPIIGLLERPEENFRLVSLSLSDNQILTYTREKRHIQQPGDLLQFVLDVEPNEPDND